MESIGRQAAQNQIGCHPEVRVVEVDAEGFGEEGSSGMPER